MEKNEKLTFDKLLSWKDVISLGDPSGNDHTSLSVITLEACCKNNYDRNTFNENYQKYVIDAYKEKFKTGDIYYKLLNLRPMFTKDENNNWRLTYSKVDYFVALIAIYSPILNKTEEDIAHFVEIEKNLEQAKNDDELKEKVVEYLRENKKIYIEKIKNIRENKSLIFEREEDNIIASSNQAMLESLIEGRNMIIYFIKNIDDIMEYLNGDFPVEALEGINKDRLLLTLSCMCSESDKIKDLLSDKLDAEIISSNLDDILIHYFNYVNNYTLMAKYLEKENNEKYGITSKMKFEEMDDIIITTEGTTNWFLEFKEFVAEHEELKEKLNFYDSYEELLRDKASETWKQIENKRLVKNIMVNFEMIKSGPKIDLESYNSGRKAPRITSNKEKRQAKLKHDYDILDEKLEFYENNKGVAHGVGINNFTGYFAEFYPNGSVVLDKLFRYQVSKRGENKGKEILVPAGDEAIYIMNYKEFADLSKYTKMELIQEIKDYDNKDVKRIYHSRNWKENTLKEINGEGYGGLDLGLLNMLTESISSNKEKALV